MKFFTSSIITLFILFEFFTFGIAIDKVPLQQPVQQPPPVAHPSPPAPSAKENCHRTCKHWICDQQEGTLCNTACMKQCLGDVPVKYDTPVYLTDQMFRAMKRAKRGAKSIVQPLINDAEIKDREAAEEFDKFSRNDPLRDRSQLHLRRMVNGSIYKLGVIVDGTSTARFLRSTVIAFSRGKVFLIAEQNTTFNIVIPLFDFGGKLFQSLEPEETRGFYGIDFHDSFYLNGKIYISYAAPPPPPTTSHELHPSLTKGEAGVKLNHRLILREFAVDPWIMNHTDPAFLEGRVLLEQGQTLSHRSGGFVQMSGSSFSPSILVASSENQFSRLPASYAEDVTQPFNWTTGFETWFQPTPLWVTIPHEYGTIDSCHRNRNEKTLYCLTTGTPMRQQRVIEISPDGEVNLIAHLTESFPCRFSSIMSYSGRRWQLRTSYHYFLLRPTCYTSKSGIVDGGIYGLERIWSGNETHKELIHTLTPIPLPFETLPSPSSSQPAPPPLGSRGITILQNFIEGVDSEMFISAIVGKTYESVLYKVIFTDEQQ